MSADMQYEKDEDGNTYIPSSQRNDGSWRKKRRVKEGYVPQDEVPKYESKGKQWAKGRSEYPVGLAPADAKDADIKKENRIPGLSLLEDDLNENQEKKKDKKKPNSSKKKRAPAETEITTIFDSYDEIKEKNKQGVTSSQPLLEMQSNPQKNNKPKSNKKNKKQKENKLPYVEKKAEKNSEKDIESFQEDESKDKTEKTKNKIEEVTESTIKDDVKSKKTQKDKKQEPKLQKPKEEVTGKHAVDKVKKPAQEKKPRQVVSEDSSDDSDSLEKKNKKATKTKEKPKRQQKDKAKPDPKPVQPLNSTGDITKRLKVLKKKVKDIEKLIKKVESGEVPRCEKDDDRINKKSEYLEEIKQLEALSGH